MRPRQLLAMLVAVVLLAVIQPQVSAQTPMGTAFTYQGQLKQDGTPLTEPVDMQFDLYDAQSGGPSLETFGPLSVSPVNGLFTQSLDFDAGLFDGSARWLGIMVGGEPLTERQEFSPVPYALHTRGTIPVVNVRDYGAVGDGRPEDQDAFQAAIDAIPGPAHGTLCIPPGTYRITADLDVASHITVAPLPGAILSIDADRTVTFRRFVAGLHQVFAGAGSAMFHQGAVREVYPEWWGAVADGQTPCSNAITKAISSIVPVPEPPPDSYPVEVPRVFFSVGTYRCSGIKLKKGVSLVGSGKYSTFLENSGDTADHHTLETPEEEQTSYVTIRDLGFRFMKNRTQGYAMNFAALVDSTIENFVIEAGPHCNEAGGIHLYSDDVLHWTHRGCWFNTIAKGKIYINSTGIRLRGEEMGRVNSNYFRDIRTYSRATDSENPIPFIEMDRTSHNLFEGIDCEADSWEPGESGDPNVSSLIKMHRSAYNVIRNSFFDLFLHGETVISISGEENSSDPDRDLAIGNIIEANSISRGSMYGVHIGGYTRKNIVRHNRFDNNTSLDVIVEDAGGEALYNELYDNFFLDGEEAGRISAEADTKTFLMLHSEEGEGLRISPGPGGLSVEGPIDSGSSITIDGTAQTVNATGNLDLQAGGTSGVFIDSASGEVGIGTSDPNSYLHLARFGGRYKWNQDPGWGDFSINNGNVGFSIGVASGGAGEGDVHIWTKGGSERLVIGNPTDNEILILDDGKVGIGEPYPSEELHVAGDICYTGTISACSDARFKERVEKIPDALSTVEKLRGVHFDWKQEEYPDRKFHEGRQVGFVAQEVKEVLPEIVSTDRDGFYSVDYGRVVPTLVEAVKELHGEVKARDEQIADLTERLAEMEALVTKLAGQTEGGAR